MMRSLYAGVSGLKTHQIKMDVIGNNIANVNTVAYKSSSITFSELMYQTTQKASGANATPVQPVLMQNRLVLVLNQERLALPYQQQVLHKPRVIPLILKLQETVFL